MEFSDCYSQLLKQNYLAKTANGKDQGLTFVFAGKDTLKQ